MLISVKNLSLLLLAVVVVNVIWCVCKLDNIEVIATKPQGCAC